MKLHEKHWLEIQNDFENSGLSLKRYSEEHNLVYPTLCYHKRRKDKLNHFTGFITAKDDNTDNFQTSEKSIEITIKEITLKLDSNKMIHLLKDIFLS